jgi:hypothetical protein
MNRVRLSWCGRAACLGDLEAQLLLALRRGQLVLYDPFPLGGGELVQLFA